MAPVLFTGLRTRGDGPQPVEKVPTESKPGNVLKHAEGRRNFQKKWNQSYVQEQSVGVSNVSYHMKWTWY